MEDLRTDALLSKTTEVKGYKILPPCVLYARVGVGGMGAVYRGHHLNLDIDVAVKCLKPSLVDDDPTFVDRFKREGRSAAKINHQNVIRVFDVAEHLGLHYLIMEFVSGETARQRVERKGALDISEALQVVYEASLGLGEAHRMGIIHRDVKPDNLLVSSRGQVKVADLGLAKPAVSSGQSMLSMAGQVMGTPPYMPPEQWGEGTVTAASDVWAMGAVLYYLLTAREAIHGESLASIMSKIVLHEFPDVRQFRPDVPDEVMQVLTKATAKNPGDRYLDAYALADAIGQLPQHRISLADTDAGTTELRTMLSPPPNARINEIKNLLRSKTPTVREQVPAEPEVVDGAGGSGGRFPWLAVVILLLLLGGGGAGYVYRDQLFPKNPVTPTPKTDALADAKALAGERKFVQALVSARTAVATDPKLAGDPLLATLREGVARQLQAALVKSEPSAPVVAGALARFAGELGESVEELTVGGVAVTFQGSSFEVSLVPPENGTVRVQAKVAGEELVDLEPWTVTFRADDKAKDDKVKDGVEPETPPLSPVAFEGALSTEPAPGRRNTIGQSSLTVVGKASERDLELRCRGEVLDEVVWKADGGFRAKVDLPVEGANKIELTVVRAGDNAQDASAEQVRSLEVYRLTEKPELDLVTPAKAVSQMTETEVRIEVLADEWTESVSARAGSQVVQLEKGATKDGKVTWRAAQPIELDDNKNSLEITATNVTGKVRSQPLTITCVAKPLQITGITVVAGSVNVAVQPGKTVYVNRRPEVSVAVSDAKAKVLSAGAVVDNRFAANLKPGQSKQFSIRAEKGLRESMLWTFEVVCDAKLPLVTVDKVPAVAPGAEITLRGRFSDDHGVQSVALQKGANALLSAVGAKSGTWSTRVRAGKASSTMYVVATDVAGNKKSVPVAIEVVQPKPVVAKPARIEPERKPGTTTKPKPEPKVQLSAKIDKRLFTPVGKLNKKGFPLELRHKQTGITLVAVNFVDTMDPSYYVAKRVVSNQQWDGDNGAGTAPKVSVTWTTVARQVNSPRFEGLSMVTKQQWQRVRNGKVPGLVTGEKAEWLAMDRNDSLTMRAVANGADVKMLKYTDSNKYVGFRVGFAPR